MSVAAQYIPAAYSLTAVGVWGASDFLGGVGARRVNAFLFTAIVHSSGLVVVGTLALMTRSPFPGNASLGWSLIAGSVAGLALALFYRSLASGNMGLVAPVAAVLGAAIPTIVTAFAAGFPGYRHVLGFILAGIGVWLISRIEGSAGRPEGIGMAVLAGIGFAGFYLCIHRAGNASALWVAACSRFASLLVTGAFVLFGRHLRAVPAPVLTIALLAGILDITGSIVFIRAAQIGRLDAAVVLSSLYPAVTVVLARVFLHEHFSRARTIGMVAALVAVPMIAGGQKLIVDICEWIVVGHRRLADHYPLSTIHCYSDAVPLLEVRNLTKIFDLAESPFGNRRTGGVRAVDDVSLDIEEGETLGLVGESGSGKSTLGRLILRLLEPTSGAIVFAGVDLLQASGSELRRLRRDMQAVFQDPSAPRAPGFRVDEGIAEPLILHRKIMHESLGRAARRQRVRELLRAVGMDESAMARYPNEFSGGQRQRIGIARALALRPKFIVADEPVSALDVSVGAQIVNLLQQLQRDF